MSADTQDAGHSAESDVRLHDTLAHVLAGGFGIRAEGCPACVCGLPMHSWWRWASSDEARR